MQLGTIYPQTHIEADPGAVRSYGSGVEELGFGHILAFDHVVGANVARVQAGTSRMTSRPSFMTLLCSFRSSQPSRPSSVSSQGY